jgi:GTP-binding nuclear protein Ran
MNTYRLAIIGEKGVGKSNFLRRYFTGEYCKDNVALSENTLSDVFHTSHGIINIQITEVHDNLPIGLDGVIIMFDVHNQQSFDTLPDLVDMAKQVTNNVVLCGNKVDLKNRVVTWKKINKTKMNGRPFDLQYYEYSCRSNYNFDKPVVYLLQHIYNDSFCLTEQPPIDSPDATHFLYETIINNI